MFHPALVRLVPSRFLMPENKHYRTEKQISFSLQMYIVQIFNFKASPDLPLRIVVNQKKSRNIISPVKMVSGESGPANMFD